MPTFSAVQLDRLLEPGYSTTNTAKTTSLKQTRNKEKFLEDAYPSPRLERRNTTTLPVENLRISSLSSSSSRRSIDFPPPTPQLRRRNSVSNGAPFVDVNNVKTTARAPQISPALYATPEPTPLPGSPTPSYEASPFVVNHKRRGPRLSKSFSERNVAETAAKEDVISRTRRLSEEHVPPVVEELRNGGEADVVGNREVNGDLLVENGEEKAANGSSLERDGGSEVEDFFDPQESMNYSSSTEAEDYGAERSARSYNTPMGEFYDAWEELSSDSGRQPTQRSLSDVETELREMRLSLLMEIEKRKQIEETANTMRAQWEALRERLRAVGVNLPVDLGALAEDSHSDVTPTEDICRQIHLARFVSESIGRGFAKAEVEAEMEAQLEMKNFEIARLCDRLHYYETMNREMSQRNQEAVEIARRERQKRRRRQKWVWGSIATAITLGSAALVWSYLPSGKGPSSTKYVDAPEPGRDKQ